MNTGELLGLAELVYSAEIWDWADREGKYKIGNKYGLLPILYFLMRDCCFLKINAEDGVRGLTLCIGVIGKKCV